MADNRKRKHCGKCGQTILKANEVFCTKCGNKLNISNQDIKDKELLNYSQLKAENEQKRRKFFSKKKEYSINL